jgi:hypothetical protein
LNKISQLDPLLTDLAQSNGYYEFILHRPNETARNGRRYDRLHLRCKKQAEFKPGSKWGGKDGSVASDAGGDVQPGKRNTRKRGSQVCDMSICNSRV